MIYRRMESKRALWVCLLAVTFVSCIDRLSHRDMVEIDVQERTPADQLLESGSRFIPLETNDDCLISNLSKMIKHDRLYIQDNHRILVFDPDGGYLSQVNRRGRGPEEYPEIRDFSVFNDKIYVLSRVNKSIYVYDSAGLFEGRYRLNDWYDRLYVQSAECVWLYSGFSNGQKYNIILYNPVLDSYPAAYAPYGENQGYSTQYDVFHPTSDGLIVTLPFDYHLYRLTAEGMEPVCELTFKRHSLDKQGKDFVETAEKTRNKEVVRHIKQVDVTVDRIYVEFDLFYEGRGIKSHLSRIDRQTHLAQSCLLEDVSNGEYPFISMPKGMTDGIMQTVYGPASVKGLIEYYKVDVTKYGDLSIDNNPVLFEYRLK